MPAFGKPFHYRNDGSGRDCYINEANRTVHRSGRLAMMKEDSSLSGWPDQLVAGERARHEKLEATRSPQPSPRNIGVIPPNVPAFNPDEILSRTMDRSLRSSQYSPRTPSSNASSLSGTISSGMRLPSPRGLATAQSPERLSKNMLWMESTTHRSQRTGRHLYASDPSTPRMKTELPGVQRTPTYYGRGI